MKWLADKLKLIVLVLLLASVLVTYLTAVSGPREEQGKEVTLSIMPEYRIISGKAVRPYPQGTVFEQGMASYFYAVQPEIRVTPQITVKGMEAGELNGSIISRAVLQAVDDKSQLYWQYELSRNQPQTFRLAPGSEGQASFASEEISIAVVSAYETVTQIAEELQFPNGSLQIIVSSDINIMGSVNGHPMEKNVQVRLPFSLQTVYFSVPKAQDASASISLTTGNAARSKRGAVVSVLLDHRVLLLLTFGLFLLYLFFFVYDHSRQRKTENSHQRFREWITEGSAEILERQRKVKIYSLEGLVDLAIDLNKRVIYDSERGMYYVLTEDMAYLYDLKN